MFNVFIIFIVKSITICWIHSNSVMMQLDDEQSLHAALPRAMSPTSFGASTVDTEILDHPWFATAARKDHQYSIYGELHVPTNLVAIDPPAWFEDHSEYEFYRQADSHYFSAYNKPEFEFACDYDTDDPKGRSSQNNLEIEPDFEFDAPLSSFTAAQIEEQPEHESYCRWAHTDAYTDAAVDTPMYPIASKAKLLREQSPTSHVHFPKRLHGSSPRSRNRRCRRTKAIFHYHREHRSPSRASTTELSTPSISPTTPQLCNQEIGPKRKHCAFIQEQELRCLFSDRVGTSHLSEPQPGDDIHGQLTVDELSVGGELSAGEDVTQGPSMFAITDIPDEGLSLR